MPEKQPVGVDVTPEMIEQLLSEGIVEADTDNAHVTLMYDTVPRMNTEGWQE